MEKMKTINQAMIEEHAIINTLYEQFKEKLNRLANDESKSTFRNLLGDFNKFKWNLEKHFFVEEKIIISSYLSIEDKILNEDIQQILSEHQEIINQLTEIEEDLIAGVKPKIDDFSDFFNEHEKNEENYFYPKLDEELPVEFRTKIIERCKEAIIG
jgi:hemerythrin-like domain-containing protein